MRELRVWFVLWLAAMVLLVSLPAPPLRSAGVPDGAEPVAAPPDFGAWADVRLNGRRLQNPYHDAYPYVAASSGEVLVPLRLVTEAMGGAVAWEEGTQTVTLTWRGRRALLTIGSTEAVVGGEPVTLDRAPALWLDRTMVSHHLIARLFGADVTFDRQAHQLVIRRAGVLCAAPYC